MSAIVAQAPAADLIAEVRGTTLWIVLNRPQAFNSITPAMLDQLEAALELAEQSNHIRVVALSAQGKAFCTGADLKAVLAGSPSHDPETALVEFLVRAKGVFKRIANLRQPTIAAVNGIAMAGGIELVLCCDLAVAAASARFGEGHARYGQLPGGGASYRLPRRIGLMRAKHLTFTGDLIDAQTAFDWGLVGEVVNDAQLEAATDALAARIADKSPLGLGIMKSLIIAGQSLEADEAHDAEISESGRYARSHDRNEGLKAFAEKRRPVFNGT